MKGLANRRHHEQRLKARATRIMCRWFGKKDFTPRMVGRNASTHCRPCSCQMCQKETRRPENSFLGGGECETGSPCVPESKNKSKMETDQEKDKADNPPFRATIELRGKVVYEAFGYTIGEALDKLLTPSRPQSPG